MTDAGLGGAYCFVTARIWDRANQPQGASPRFWPQQPWATSALRQIPKSTCDKWRVVCRAKVGLFNSAATASNNPHSSAAAYRCAGRCSRSATAACSRTTSCSISLCNSVFTVCSRSCFGSQTTSCCGWNAGKSSENVTVLEKPVLAPVDPPGVNAAKLKNYSHRDTESRRKRFITKARKHEKTADIGNALFHLIPEA